MTAATGFGDLGSSSGIPRRVVAVLRRFVRGNADAAAWERPALLGLIVVTAALYLVNLSVSGWANAFYSAAAQAGSTNWIAFFYGSSDAANSITVDKPPLSIWFMALSVRIFGLSSFAILLPEALMGVATVGVLYATVRRRFPAPVALLAGFALAITPVAALMFRFNNPDALLVLLLSLATYFTLRGIETGRLTWVLWAGAMVGFAFLTKQLQAFLILPVLGGVYLWAAPIALRKRLGHLAAALGAVIVSAGWWVAVVELVPASMRPYIGGSQTNSFLELTFGYNGLGRLTGQETGSVTGGRQNWGYTGIDRLFSGDIGAQITWLMFAALAFVGITLVLMRRLPRTSPTRATLLLLGGTMIVTALAFSYMAGIFHAYYTVAFAPALAGTFAIGVGMLWRRRRILWVRIAMAVITAGTAAWGWELLSRSEGFVPWLKWVVLALGAAGAVLLVLPRSGRGVTVAAASVALASVLAGPLAFTLVTLTVGHTGSIVTAGPGRSLVTPGILSHPGGPGPSNIAAGKPGGPGSSQGATPVGPGSALSPGGALGPGAAGPGAAGAALTVGGGLLDAANVPASLAAKLALNGSDYTWVAAAIGSQEAAGFQLATGMPVMPIGGFNGSDPSPTLAQFQSLARSGQIHWYVAGSVGRPNGGSVASIAIRTWIEATYTPVLIGTVQLYDLTRPLA